jgi:hypothetical protein
VYLGVGLEFAVERWMPRTNWKLTFLIFNLSVLFRASLVLRCLLAALVHHTESAYGITRPTFVGRALPSLFRPKPKTSNQNSDRFEPLVDG